MWASRYWAPLYWANRYWSDAPDESDGILVFIDGQNITELVHTNTINYGNELENRAKCDFMLVEDGPPPYYRPVVGESIEITLDGDLVFAGSIDAQDESETKNEDVAVFYKVKCVDNAQILDRHLVARIYEDQTAGGIIKDVIDKDVPDAEGINVDNVQDGLLIGRAVFGYRRVSDVLRDLSKITGFSWWVDQFRNLHFVDRSTNAAPFGLSDGSANFRNPKINKKRGQYVNIQYIRGGDDLTDPRQDDFIGDGERKSFVTAFPVGTVPTITVNAAAQTVGIRGVDSDDDFEWFWSKGDSTIKQSDSGTAITDSDTLEVTYRGLFPIIALVTDEREIADRVSIEGGGGEYQMMDEDDSIESTEFALSKAAGILERHGKIPVIFKYETDDRGLRAGQLQPISLLDFGDDVDGSFLVDSTKSRVVDTGDGQEIIRTSVVVLSGLHLGSWYEFFRKMQDAGRTYKLNANEKIQTLEQSKEVLEIVETFSSTDPLGDEDDDPFTGWVWGSATWGKSFWGAPAV